MIVKKRLTLIMVFLLSLVCLLGNVNGFTATDTEVKAAFLCQFPKFVEWPDSSYENANSAFVIGVLGDDSLASSLHNMVNGKAIDGRKLVVKRSNNVGSLKNCKIVYISPSAKGSVSRTIEEFKGTPTLTVSDIGGFAKKGGVLGFVYKNDKIGLEINPEAAKRNKLKISSKLLRLAQIVES